MVPGLFVSLPALPLTVNGKLDRAALPAPELAAVDPNAYVAPRNEIEEILASIWVEVLGVTPISVNDDFFDIGGHSLAAMQVMTRIREELGVDLALRDLFEATTLQSLARHVAGVRAESSVSARNLPSPDMQEGVI
jgi:acyl carrier protein